MARAVDGAMQDGDGVGGMASGRKKRRRGLATGWALAGWLGAAFGEAGWLQDMAMGRIQGRQKRARGGRRGKKGNRPETMTLGVCVPELIGGGERGGSWDVMSSTIRSDAEVWVYHSENGAGDGTEDGGDGTAIRIGDLQRKECGSSGS